MPGDMRHASMSAHAGEAAIMHSGAKIDQVDSGQSRRAHALASAS